MKPPSHRTMQRIVLFDWGDTLMVDFDQPGAMKNWPRVEAITGALDTLDYLSKTYILGVASGALKTTPADMAAALSRVELDSFFSHFFCPQNVGQPKQGAIYYQAIADLLNAQPCNITMVGDSLEKDVLPAIDAGMHAIHYNPTAHAATHHSSVPTIASLLELKQTL